MNTLSTTLQHAWRGNLCVLRENIRSRILPSDFEMIASWIFLKLGFKRNENCKLTTHKQSNATEATRSACGSGFPSFRKHRAETCTQPACAEEILAPRSHKYPPKPQSPIVAASKVKELNSDIAPTFFRTKTRSQTETICVPISTSSTSTANCLSPHSRYSSPWLILQSLG